MNDMLKRLKSLRRSYLAVRQALPWFDAGVWQGADLAFPDYAHELPTPFAQVAPLARDMAGLCVFAITPFPFPRTETRVGRGGGWRQAARSP